MVPSGDPEALGDELPPGPQASLCFTSPPSRRLLVLVLTPKVWTVGGRGAARGVPAMTLCWRRAEAEERERSAVRAWSTWKLGFSSRATSDLLFVRSRVCTHPHPVCLLLSSQSLLSSRRLNVMSWNRVLF